MLRDAFIQSFADIALSPDPDLAVAALMISTILVSWALVAGGLSAASREHFWPSYGLFLVSVLVHELGHVFELRRQGVPASAPLFIPFLGAVVGMKQMPEDAWKEARVALAGPVLGTLGSVAVWGFGEALDSPLLIALAFTGFFLNLFNLIPIVPLDGGQAVAAVHPALWALGLAGLVALAFWHPNPVLILILVVGALELWRRWREREHPAGAAYYKVTTAQRVTAGAVYVGLAVFLAVAMTATHVERTF